MPWQPCFMTTMEEFEAAQVQVKQLKKTPGALELLDLYSLFKQGTLGDVRGKRPGMLDMRGRAKYDAWASKKGLSVDDARSAYVQLVESLEEKYR